MMITILIISNKELKNFREIFKIVWININKYRIKMHKLRKKIKQEIKIIIANYSPIHLSLKNYLTQTQTPTNKHKTICIPSTCKIHSPKITNSLYKKIHNLIITIITIQIPSNNSNQKNKPKNNYLNSNKKNTNPNYNLNHNLNHNLNRNLNHNLNPHHNKPNLNKKNSLHINNNRNVSKMTTTKSSNSKKS
jgi:hypothetical protein